MGSRRRTRVVEQDGAGGLEAAVGVVWGAKGLRRTGEGGLGINMSESRGRIQHLVKEVLPTGEAASPIGLKKGEGDLSIPHFQRSAIPPIGEGTLSIRPAGS